MPAHCHKLIADTAREMAHSLYETMMTDNDWYKLWKKQNFGASPKALETRFVNKNWGKLIANAKATLVEMLSGPYEEGLKLEIYEALQLDATLMRGRKRVGEGMNIVKQGTPQ